MKLVKKIINHKVFFWMVIFIAIINLTVFILDKSYNCVIIFVAAAFLSIHFIKNMALALFTTILISNFVFGCTKVKEGLTEPTGKKDQIEELEGLMGELSNVKNNVDATVDPSSMATLMNLKDKIDINKLKNPSDMKAAVKHLRDNKELLKGIIDKF